LLYSEIVNVGTLAKDAMNYIQFNQDVNPVGAFFVGIDVSGVQAQDTFVLYQSMRNNGDENNFYFKQSGNWHSFKDNNNGAMVNVMELIACNFDEAETDTPSVVIPADVWIYPNPTKSLITVASKQDIMVESMQVFNLLGQEINVPLVSVEEKSVQLDFSGKTPGIYIVRFNYNGSFVQRKFSVVSN
jgi:lysyl endopeptidase